MDTKKPFHNGYGYIIDGNMIIFEILLNIVGLAFYHLILHPSVNEGQ